MLCQAKRAKCGRAHALKTVPPDLEGVVRSLTAMVQGGRDQLADLLLIGWRGGKWQSASSTYRFQLLWGLRACGQHAIINRLTSPTWRGFQYLQNSSKILLGVSLEGEPGPCPQGCSSLVSHPLPSLISNCLNLPVGTQGRSWRLNEAHFL